MASRFFPGYPVHRVDWGFEIVHIIFWALLVAAIVWLVVWLVRAPHHGVFHEHVAPPPPSEDAALREARMRYAPTSAPPADVISVS